MMLDNEEGAIGINVGFMCVFVLGVFVGWLGMRGKYAQGAYDHDKGRVEVIVTGDYAAAVKDGKKVSEYRIGGE